jgi:hypothetical protein
MLSRGGLVERDNHARISLLILVSGVVLSSVLGTFFYFRTDLSTALATFAGLIGITITLQIESLLRTRQDREQATRHQRLVARMESTAWLPDVLDRALGAYGLVEQKYGRGVVVELARQIFEDCQDRLEFLARGRYRTADPDESPKSPMRTLTEHLRTHLRATSAGEDLLWWQDALATRAYWQLNLEALQRGVSITRIFIYRAWSDDLDHLARAHHEAGVHVMRVQEDRLPRTSRLNLLIWDETCAMEPEYNSAGEWINSSFVFEPQDLVLMLDRFRLIESYAEPFGGL